MRLWTFARWVIILGVLGWAGYAVAGAGWNYFATQEVVDRALREATIQHRAAFATGNLVAVDALANSVRASILVGTRHDGLHVQEENVRVSANSAGMSAAVRWSYPILTYRGSEILVIPLSIERSLVMSP